MELYTFIDELDSTYRMDIDIDGNKVLIESDCDFFDFTSEQQDELIKKLELEGPWDIRRKTEREYGCDKCDCGCNKFITWVWIE